VRKTPTAISECHQAGPYYSAVTVCSEVTDEVTMEIILVKEVQGLGTIGDVVKVKDGYANNFLIPKGLAKVATKATMNTIEEEKKKLRRLEEKKKKEFLDLAEKINNASCTISMRAGEEDKLFGAVTNEAIARACAADGITIDRHTIQIEEPIRKLGVYQVLVKLHPEVTATLKVWVVKE
jgi:large subunit ribosomal protein L9